MAFWAGSNDLALAARNSKLLTAVGTSEIFICLAAFYFFEKFFKAVFKIVYKHHKFIILGSAFCNVF